MPLSRMHWVHSTSVSNAAGSLADSSGTRRGGPVVAGFGEAVGAVVVAAGGENPR